LHQDISTRHLPSRTWYIQVIHHLRLTPLGAPESWPRSPSPTWPWQQGHGHVVGPGVTFGRPAAMSCRAASGGGWPGCITCGLEDVASKCLDATNPGLRAIFLTNSMSWLCFKEFHWFYCDCILVCACLCIGSLGKQQLIWRHFLVSVYGILSEETTSSKGYDMMPLISFELCWQLYSSIKEFFAPVIQGCKA